MTPSDREYILLALQSQGVNAEEYGASVRIELPTGGEYLLTDSTRNIRIQVGSLKISLPYGYPSGLGWKDKIVDWFVTEYRKFVPASGVN